MEQEKASLVPLAPNSTLFLAPGKRLQL